jgi:hypothetical protein
LKIWKEVEDMKIKDVKIEDMKRNLENYRNFFLKWFEEFKEKCEWVCEKKWKTFIKFMIFLKQFIFHINKIYL